MIDTHYDLLTIAYVSYLKNDYTYLEQISKYFNERNVTGVIANLYFMEEDEMKEELGEDYYRKDVSVLEMFIKAKSIVETFFPDTDILYSIEGADYIKDPNELEALYEAGLDSLIMCWNTRSKYASGLRSRQGLTELGKQLLYKEIELGMGIDLSHANKKSFYDMVYFIKQEQAKGLDICIYASHSNSRSLCDRERNLDDHQLQQIKDIDGLVGLLSNRNFVVQPNVKDIATKEEQIASYLEHIDYVSSIIGLDNVMLATDDMDFLKDIDKEYADTAIYKYDEVASKLSEQLNRKYGYETAYNIMHRNAHEKIFTKIRNKRNNKKRGEK